MSDARDDLREAIARPMIEEAIERWQRESHWWGDPLPSFDIARVVAEEVVRWLAVLPPNGWEQVGGFRFLAPDDPLRDKHVHGVVMARGWEAESDVMLYRRVEVTPPAEPPEDYVVPAGVGEKVVGRYRLVAACPTCGSTDPANALCRYGDGVDPDDDAKHYACSDPWHGVTT